MLQDFLHTVLGLRKIYIGAEHLNMRVFGALNKAMYGKQRSIFLSRSIWVIGQGGDEDENPLLEQDASVDVAIHKVDGNQVHKA